MLVSFFCALIGCLITGVQSVLIYIQGEGVCFNEGCKIADSLTLVDPLYFNLAGFFFFLIVLIGLSRARKGSSLWQRFTSLLLLAGLAAEAVLLSFQIIIIQAICSYCLIIMALIVLANMCMGLKQMFKGMVIFSAVLIASFSLDYRGGAVTSKPLEQGTMARYQPENSSKRLLLFISSSCTHCQSVLDSLKDNPGCAVDFNPVDRYDNFSFPDAEPVAGYKPRINLHYLKKLGISEVPVLLDRQETSMLVIRGGEAIKAYIDQQCGPRLPQPPAPALQQSAEQMSSMSTSSYALPLPGEEDGCAIEEDCEDPLGQSSLQQQ
ncbi:MAG: hypothetical protein KJO28_09965 [Desulfofustis sp.]|nr:hypothetical protein [Desulfofustis sp.]